MRKRLLLVLPLLSACSQFDGAKLEAAIKSKFESEKVAVREVKCPADRELKAGDSFTCAGVSGLGDNFTVKVTQKDDQGNVNWELEGTVEGGKSATVEFKEDGSPDAEGLMAIIGGN